MKRGLSLVTRNSVPDELETFRERDLLPTWSSFCQEAATSESLTRHSVLTAKLGDDLYLFALNALGEISLRIFVHPDFTLKCFRSQTPVAIRDLLGFGQTLKTWSQLDAVVVRCKNAELNLAAELSYGISTLMDILANMDDSTETSSIKFLLHQLSNIQVPSNTRRYDPITVRQAALLYLCSRGCYNQLRGILALPCAKTLRKYFAGFQVIAN